MDGAWSPIVSIRFTGNGGILHYDGQDENTKEKADAGGDDNTGTKQQSHGREREYNRRDHNTTDKRKNNTHEKPMGKVTDLGDINDKCVRQDANVPDATAQRSAVGQHGCT